MVEVLAGTVTTVDVPSVAGTLSLTSQTAPVSRTTLFTAASGGLYRIHAYMLATNTGSNTENVNLWFYWNDGVFDYNYFGGCTNLGSGPQDNMGCCAYVAAGETLDYEVKMTGLGQATTTYSVWASVLKVL